MCVGGCCVILCNLFILNVNALRRYEHVYIIVRRGKKKASDL